MIFIFTSAILMCSVSSWRSVGCSCASGGSSPTQKLHDVAAIAVVQLAFCIIQRSISAVAVRKFTRHGIIASG